MSAIRISEAARHLGMSVSGVHKAAIEDRLPHTTTVSGQRIFAEADLEAYLGKTPPATARVEALYCRVSGTTGQESSLKTQEVDLRTSATGEIFRTYKDRAPGLRESRKGLDKLLDDAAEGRFTVLRVTHRDRLARFGTAWIERYLQQCGVSVEMLHDAPDKSMHEELLEDFLAIIASFSGRFYKLRSKQNQLALLTEAERRIGEP